MDPRNGPESNTDDPMRRPSGGAPYPHREGTQNSTQEAKPTTRTQRITDGSKKVADGSKRAARGSLRLVRKLTQAQGMGQTGLYKLVEVHIFHMGGDSAMAIGLAGTIFFQATTSGARDQVGLALLLMMAPFAVVAPLIGPLLDRVRRGRRWAIGSTMAIRAFLCWVLASVVVDEGNLLLYPAALGCLIASKAYNVTRSVAVPRLLPDGLSLVRANSRMSLAGIAGTGTLGALAAGAGYFGPEWALRFAFVVFVIGTILSILLPPRVDSPEGEQSPGQARGAAKATTTRGVTRLVVMGMRSNAAIRGFSGFLLLFLAFLLRDEGQQELLLPGWPAVVLSGLVAGAYGAGAAVGIGLGALARTKRPDIMIRVLLGVAAASAIVAATLYGLITLAIAAFIAGVAHQLGKLGLDALIQSEVPEHIRTGVFARSETLLQLTWVLGGGIGILIPLNPHLGFGIAAVWLVATLILVLRTTGKPRRATEPEEPASAAPASTAPASTAPEASASEPAATPDAADLATRVEPTVPAAPGPTNSPGLAGPPGSTGGAGPIGPPATGAPHRRPSAAEQTRAVPAPHGEPPIGDVPGSPPRVEPASPPAEHAVAPDQWWGQGSDHPADRSGPKPHATYAERPVQEDGRPTADEGQPTRELPTEPTRPRLRPKGTGFTKPDHPDRAD